MPLELLYQLGLLLVVMLAAFAVSAAVGMLIGRNLTTPDLDDIPGRVAIVALPVSRHAHDAPSEPAGGTKPAPAADPVA